jgi:uncharacterized protein
MAMKLGVRCGLMQRRVACINDAPIVEAERKFFWPLGRRPDGHPILNDLGL